MRARKAVSLASFAAELAPVLGNEQALAMVQAAVRHLGHRSDMLVLDQQRAVLVWLGEQPGVVGAAARHLLRRFDGGNSRPPRPSQASVSSHRPGPVVTRAELTTAFERTVSTERAREMIDKACRARGVVEETMSLEAATRILEDLAGNPGIVGVVARFAKARLALRFPAEA